MFDLTLNMGISETPLTIRLMPPVLHEGIHHPRGTL